MKKLPLLSGIRSPRDLKRLRFDQLSILAEEVRYLLIATVSRTGGHLASNLGVVELTIALHRVFSSPRDSIVFDVGHQCYTHKLLTGRREQFPTLRQEGGLSGFPKRAESEHDAFIAGHSSTSISAAVGIARAKKLAGKPGKAIAVIGDGALSGVAFEALNNIDPSLDNLIVVVNDNGMSISKNLSTIARHLAKIRNTSRYYRVKDGFERTVRRIPFIGGTVRGAISAVKSAAKGTLYHSNLFEDMGFTYLGPVEGHNLPQLCAMLARAKMLREPVLVHVHTQKGKGYRQAEENPGAFHGVSKFNPREIQSNEMSPDTFSEQAGICLTRLGERDKRIVAVTAAMKYATGLHHFSTRFREEGRFFDVGIAESHAVVFSSALAANGFLPVFCVYSSFLQRSFDQLLHDCSLEPSHVVIGVDRAGLIGEDGETHQGLFDVAMLCAMPGAVIYSPATCGMLQRDFRRALYEETGLAAVRYPRGKPTLTLPEGARDWRDYWCVGEGSGTLAITYGRVAENVFEAVRLSGKACDVLLLERIFPLPEEVLARAEKYEKVVFVEEGAATGGLARLMGALLLERGYRGIYRVCAVEHPVIPQGTVVQCMRMAGLDAPSIAQILGNDGKGGIRA